MTTEVLPHGLRLTDRSQHEGVVTTEFTVEGAGGEIPGALWTPIGAGLAEEGAALPLVLIGHGASGHRHEDYVEALGRALAHHHQMAAAAIDGPVHGARRADGSGSERAFMDFVAAWSSDEQLTDRMVDDWRRVLDALGDLPGIAGPVGYWGLSMGTILGLPFVASEDRISAAVLGLMGMTGPTRARIEADAPRVRCPVLFLVQWSDELFARETAFELFDALGTDRKTLHANPGTHGEVPNHEFAATIAFLAHRLSPRA